MFYIYVLKSKKDNDLYVGFTNNLERRIKEHNNSLVLSTKSRRPFDLIYCEGYKSEKDARKREQNLKLRSKTF
ncbi:MAG: GIY-YIG nuclease family protein, partial [Candidatus Omnitrophica bacterium]|nr:GIY-YIG nuclease family protein [Candidatus Omnitrophota bacterium]